MIVRRIVFASAALALLGTTVITPAAAQDAPPPPVVWFYEMSVDITDNPEFVEGMEGWVQRIAEDGETWTWNVFESVTGPPKYVIMSPWHDFADFDRGPIVDQARQEANDEWFQENLAPYFHDPVSVMMVARGDISLPLPMGDEPPPLWNVIEFEYTEGSSEGYLAVTNAFMKVREAFEAVNAQAAAVGADAGGYNVFDVIYTEGANRMMVALPLTQFADLDGQDPLGFFNAMVATHGHEDAVMIDRVMTKYLKQTRSHLWAHRTDLSHMPDAGM
jgi:hypothetical protein